MAAPSRQTTWRTDDELLQMLDDPAAWTVNGRSGRTLATANSLRDATTEAGRLKTGHRVTAVVRRSGDLVIVFYGQIERLLTLIAAARTS